MKLKLFVLSLLMLPAVMLAQSQVQTWPEPSDEAISGDFKVEADGTSVPVSVAHVAPADPQQRWKAMDDISHSGEYFDVASFASFDLRGAANVTVTYRDEVKTAKILPSSYGIVPEIDGRRVTFRLEHPADVTIECNGETTKSLHIFANPWETNALTAGDSNIIYFGPGIHEATNTIKVASGQTLYLAGGCVLRGTGRAGPVVEMAGSHVTLRGRGILDGSECPIHTRNLLYIHGDAVTVEGVILRDSSTWNVPIRRCHGVLLENVKVFGCRANSDGFDICNSTDVTVDGCFLRTLDDLIVVKSDKGQGPVQHVVARNCVLWNQVAHALSVGAELRDPVDDVLFTNCDVIHDTGREWTLRIYHCDSAVVSNVRFENIRVEESRKLISLWINKAIWSKEAERGHIRDVTFRDITATTAQQPRVELMGYDEAHGIDGVVLDKVKINGAPLTAGEVVTNAFVRDVKVKP